MKKFIKQLRDDKILLRSFGATFILILATIVFTLIFYVNLPPLIPLFNQLPWGVDRLGAKFTIFLPIIVTFVILIINLILSFLAYATMPLVSRMIAITSFIVSLLTFIFIIRTIQLIL